MESDSSLPEDLVQHLGDTYSVSREDLAPLVVGGLTALPQFVRGSAAVLWRLPFGHAEILLARILPAATWEQPNGGVWRASVLTVSTLLSTMLAITLREAADLGRKGVYTSGDLLFLPSFWTRAAAEAYLTDVALPLTLAGLEQRQTAELQLLVWFSKRGASYG